MRELGLARYVSVTTFRRDGEPVPTPVWVVGHDDALYIWTDAASGKAKRIRREPRVTVAACGVRGVVRGPMYPATAEILDDERSPEIRALFHRKYGWQIRALAAATSIGGFLRRGPKAEPRPIYIRLRASGR